MKVGDEYKTELDSSDRSSRQRPPSRDSSLDSHQGSSAGRVVARQQRRPSLAGRRRKSLSGMSTGSAGPLFFMNDVDVSKSHGHGTVPIPGRESHTADLEAFDRYVKILADAERAEFVWDDDGEEIEGFLEGSDEDSVGSGDDPPQDVPLGIKIKTSELQEVEDALDNVNLSANGGGNRDGKLLATQVSEVSDFSQKTQYPFNPEFWAYIRSILSNAKPVGFGDLPDPSSTIVKGPEDATNFISKVISIGLLNPIQPKLLAKAGGFSEDVVLAELFYATGIGLVAMRFSPECIRCGSAVMEADMLGRVPKRAMCSGCNAPNTIESLDKIKTMFLLNSEVLYVLAENYACTPSAKSMEVTSIFAAIPGNSTGSGYSYCVGTGKETEIAPALEPGKYRMHCPVAKTDNYLVVKRKAEEGDKAVQLNMKVSDLVFKHKRGQKKVDLVAGHGKIQFNIFPDTMSFFVLWVQKDVDDKTLMHLPEEERAEYTSASEVIHHPVFNALFQDSHVDAVQKSVFLSISNVVLVFTDIVDSTKLYASLGDGPAFNLVRKHFQVVFGAFTRNGGRVIKTIGDAVMASFTTGQAAMKAVSEAMILLPTIGRRIDNNNFVEIRVGIHAGQVAVVPLNGVNDYFGQTTNIAARVQSAAKGSECFITEKILESDEAKQTYDEITGIGSSFEATPWSELNLKGVSGKVRARGFRKVERSRRGSQGGESNYDERCVTRRYSMRKSLNTSTSSIESSYVGRKSMDLGTHDEE